jgi:hypothetical protein
MVYGRGMGEKEEWPVEPGLYVGDLEPRHGVHSEAWWASLFEDYDPTDSDWIATMGCPFCGEPCDDRETTMDLLIQFGRSPATATYRFAHVDCARKLIHPKHRELFD